MRGLPAGRLHGMMDKTREKERCAVIRKAFPHELPRILEIYAAARAFMARTGNPTQWGASYPPEALLREDLRQERLYVVEEEGAVRGVFVLLLGEDPTYRVIEDGAWLSDAPYGAIHRVAGDGSLHGLVGRITEFAWQIIPHLRIDTHRDNAVMRHQVEKYGFVPCGTIYTDDGTPRIAFERV